MKEKGWRKSSYSSSGNCVEVANSDRDVRVRDTKSHGAGPELKFTASEWRRFLAKVKAS